MQNIGDKQYVARYESGEWVIRLIEIVKQERSTYIARCSDKDPAHKIAKALNEAEGL